MRCPKCNSADVKVTDSRQKRDRRLRKRACNGCGHRFPTTEMLGDVSGDLPLLPLQVEKKSGKLARFDRDKLRQSISIAVRKSQRADVPIGDIVDGIEQEAALSRDQPLSTKKIGEQALAGLAAHDRLAYVRYLSAHQTMETSAEIRALIGELQTALARFDIPADDGGDGGGDGGGGGGGDGGKDDTDAGDK